MKKQSLWIVLITSFIFIQDSTGGAKPITAVPDVIIGNPEAPSTIIEYSSFTCGHCAHFHKTVLPQIKRKYLDTGKVKLIFRHFPLDPMSVKIYAIFMQVPLPKQEAVLQKIFEKQAEWQNDNYIAHISRICNVPYDKALKCLKDQDLENAILMKRLEAERTLNINATPYFLINGRVIAHALSFPEMDALLAPRS